MKLSALLFTPNDFQIFGPTELRVKNLVDDSRKVRKGSLFIAIKGLSVDAHKFIPNAILQGAVVVVGEKSPHKHWLDKITYIKVPDSRRALALLASAWHGYPSKKLKIVGVTGTDGKTTTANLIYWILKKAGKRAGLISTISAKIGDKEYETGFHVTSPEPFLLQKFLSRMVEAKCKYAVLEVTSHGLIQERVAGIDFDIAVLTNITHEHIDYHKTYAKYLEAKAALFKKAKTAILNRDDSSFKRVKKLLRRKTKVLDYDHKTLKGNIKDIVDRRFPESYNRLNATAAVVAARVLGAKESKIAQALKVFPGVSGRMEEIKNKKGIKVIVDFAHTPNALKNVLQSLKDSKEKDSKLLAVFGCAGERDVAKRPMMVKIAASLADISIFTAEDPRTEEINSIIEQMVQGARKVGAEELEASRYKEVIHGNKSWFVRVPERGEAIAFALQKLARKGDIVVVCGKGHEKSMAYNGAEYPWSDAEAVRVALEGGVKKIKRK